MKISNDIKSMIEDDTKRLTEAFLIGEISIAGISLVDKFSEELIYQLSADIIRYQLQSRTLSIVLPYLSTMKWLTLAEACIYARKSRNTLLSLIESGKIYGTKPEGSGDYIVDRESIDGYYNTERDEMNLRLKKLRRVL